MTELLKVLSAFPSVTLVKCYGDDHELRLYIPTRIPLNEFDEWRQYALAMRLLVPVGKFTNLERNRAGMCFCLSVGTAPSGELTAAVNAARKAKGLRPL